MLPEESRCAFFWDESFLWGLVAVQSLKEAELPFDLISSHDIRAGALDHYGLLFVPGGWAGQKLAALGVEGAAAIRSFVARGGHYVGICGGAGLATCGELGLLPVTRRPGRERLPNFSGPVKLSFAAHSLWEGVTERIFPVWWPSQLVVDDPQVELLATYEEALPDAYSADIRVAEGNNAGWTKWEKLYGINLDPSRLKGEPAVLAGGFGRGRVLLSLVHFDTPADVGGRFVLRKIWENQADSQIAFPGERKRPGVVRPRVVPSPAFLPAVRQWEEMVAGLVRLGEDMSLWSWRNLWLLQWRRGIRGLEFSTLSLMVKTLAERLSSHAYHDNGRQEKSAPPLPEIGEIQEQIASFVDKSGLLLRLEGAYFRKAPLSPLSCPDPVIANLRRELFGAAMSHGGQFQSLISHLDRLLMPLL